MAPATAERLWSRLDELMAAKGISGRQLAREAETTEVAVTKLRRNSFAMVDSKVAARICRVLEITPGELFSLDTDSQSQ
jgi:DNA-binding Xre family transcriptional regulator